MNFKTALFSLAFAVLFIAFSTANVFSNPYWNRDRSVSFTSTFSQGTNSSGGASSFSQAQAASSSSRAASGESGGFLSGTILEPGDCSNKGRSILEDGPCMKACPGKCDQPNYAPCDEPCCEEPLPPVMPCFNPCMNPCMSQPYVPAVLPIDPYVGEKDYQCSQFAPIELQWVDFRIQDPDSKSFDRNLGNYRFRIFGCRRITKDVILDQGRALQKDMELIRIFEEKVSECLNIVKIPSDLCLIKGPVKLPEYILTAEIVDFHMNVCDEFDWKKSTNKNLRKGSSEITVVWRLMDITKTNILWKGSSTGYGEIKKGDPFGETTLIEKAFADAVNSLRQQPGFEKQLATRVDPKVMKRQHRDLVEKQRLFEPAKCEFKQKIAKIKKGETVAKSPLEKRVFEKRIIKKENIEKIKVYLDDNGNIISIVTNGREVPVDPVRVITHSDGSKTYTTKDGNKIRIDENNRVTFIPRGIDCDASEADCGIIIDEVEVKEPVSVIEKVTVLTPVREDEKITVISKPVQEYEKKIIKNESIETVKVYLDDNGNVISVVTNGVEVPVDTSRVIVNENGSRTYVVTDGSRIHVDSDNKITFIPRDVECEATDTSCGLFIEEIEIKEAIGVIEKVTIIEGVPVEEAVVIEDEIDEFFDVTIITEESLVKTDSRICIMERDPFEALDEQAMKEIKASIVEITNANGSRCSGVIVSEDLVISTAGIVLKDQNSYAIRTTDGREMTAKAFRVNTNKNVALFLFDAEMTYTPIAINLHLPKIGQDEITSIGILGIDNIPHSETNFTQAKGKTLGYRYDDENHTEILVDTYIQSNTNGGAAIDDTGSFRGIASTCKKLDDGPDTFIPIETVLQSVGLEICGKEFIGQKVTSTLIEEPVGKAPEEMPKKDRK